MAAGLSYIYRMSSFNQSIGGPLYCGSSLLTITSAWAEGGNQRYQGSFTSDSEGLLALWEAVQRNLRVRAETGIVGRVPDCLLEEALRRRGLVSV